MHYKIYKLLLALTIGGCLSGCVFRGADEVLIVPRLDTEFQLGMREVLSPTKNQLEFSLQTKRAINCDTAKIAAALEFTDPRTIVLQVDRVDYANDCTPGTSFANRNLSAGILIDDIYDIDVTIQNLVTNQGVLNVLPDRYRLSFFDPIGLELQSSELMRIPNLAIWGWIAYQDGERSAALTAINELRQQGLQPLSLGDGLYSYFSIDGGRLRVSGQPTTIEYFLLQENGVRPSDLEQWVTSNRQRTDVFTKVQLFTGKGNAY